jgi:hypothetical protein
MIKPVKKYSIDKVRELRSNRKNLKTNGSSMIFQTDAEYQSFLGELKGAGHLQITGFNKMNVTLGFNQLNGKPAKTYDLQYEIGIENGDKPHFTGYIQSSSNADAKPYKVNAWLNEGGNIRIEIVEKK